MHPAKEEGKLSPLCLSASPASQGGRLCSPAVSASLGSSSRIDGSGFFHCSALGTELFLSSLFTALGSPTCARGREGFNQSFSLHPGMCFESFCSVLPLSWLLGDVLVLGCSCPAPSRIDPSRSCLGLAVLVIYQAGLEMGMWCLSPSLASLGRLCDIRGGHIPPSSKTTHIPKHLLVMGGGSSLHG